MLGSITIEYNDYSKDESAEESFEDVESVSVVGNPDGPGETIIVTHTSDEEPNSVCSGVVLQTIV